MLSSVKIPADISFYEACLLAPMSKHTVGSFIVWQRAFYRSVILGAGIFQGNLQNSEQGQRRIIRISMVLQAFSLQKN